MKVSFSPIEFNDFYYFQLVDLDSDFAGLLLIDLGQFDNHLMINLSIL